MWVLLAVVLVTLAVLSGSRESPRPAQAAGAGPPPTTTPIKHVVIIMKENRSFDEYFGRFPGANGAMSGTMSNGQTVALGQTPDPMPNDICHVYSCWLSSWDGGAMDGFDQAQGASSSTGADLAYSQMTQASIPNYWAYASTYALADNMFSSARGVSFGNNLFTFAAQDGQYDPTTGNRAVYDLPATATSPESPNPWGCDAPPDTLEVMMAPDRSKSLMFPCFGFSALPNILQPVGLTWNVFDPYPSDPHNALDALRPDRFDPAIWSHVVALSNLASDAKAGTLPNVSWYISSQTEHPPASACAGENETVKLVNALMKSSEWSSTAIFVVWDDYGGFYDHVPPPVVDGVSDGFRVPLIAISPYTRTGQSSGGGSISHTLYTLASLPRFIEDNWSLPAMTPKDASANDLMDMFDFAAPVRPKLALSTRTCTPLTAAEQAAVAAEPAD